jgi:methionine--tRNA ligase beta chain
VYESGADPATAKPATKKAPKAAAGETAVLQLDGSVAAQAVALVLAVTEASATVTKGAKSLSCTVAGVELSEPTAIMRALARLAKQEALLGGDALGQALAEEHLAGFRKATAGGSIATLLDTTNTLLAPVTYAAGNTLSVADLALFVALHPVVASGGVAKHGNVVRWFNNIQHLPAVRTSAVLPAVVIAVSKPWFLDPNSAAPIPPAAKKEATGKEKGKEAAKGEEAPAAGDDKAAAKAAAKAEKDAKKAAKAPKATPAAAPIIGKLDVRVGLIKSAVDHPTEVGKLLVEEIDVGSTVLTVVSGIAAFAKPADIVGRKVCIICNLKPGDVKGVMSSGRMLVATSADGATKEILFVDGATVGENLACEGVTNAFDDPISSKNFTKLLKELSTNAEKQFLYRDTPMTTSAGPITAATVAGGVVA